MLQNKIGMIPVHLNIDFELWRPLDLRKYYQENNIKVYVSEKDETNKNAIIERFHRTLARFLMKYRLENNDDDWPRYLPNVIDGSNDKVHRTTGFRSNNLYLGKVTLHYDPVSTFNYLAAKNPT
jgi:hypothetical protein